MLRPITAAVVAALVLLSGCASRAPQGSTSGSPTASPGITSPARPDVITITSADLPSVVPVAASPDPGSPERIVSLATGVGETLAALGVGDRVVGRDETSQAPQIQSAPIVTRAHATNAEAVLALSPDLVLVDGSTSPPEALAQIESAGVRIVTVPEAWTIDDIGARTEAVAAAVGLPAAAAQSVTERATAPVGDPDGRAPRVAFLYLRGTSAIYLIGGAGSGADAMIEAAGGVDVGAEAGFDGFVPLTAEAVAGLDPDVLLVMTKGLASVGGVDGLVQLPGVAQTRAGAERRVVAVDDTLLLSFGPRTSALAQALADALTTQAA